MLSTLADKRKQLERVQADIDRLNTECMVRTTQIDAAKKRGKAAFDSERFLVKKINRLTIKPSCDRAATHILEKAVSCLANIQQMEKAKAIFDCELGPRHTTEELVHYFQKAWKVKFTKETIEQVYALLMADYLNEVRDRELGAA